MDTASFEVLKNENDALRDQVKALKLAGNRAAINMEDRLAYEDVQHRFRTIFEFSRLGNKIIGPDLSILQVNTALVSLLGYNDKKDIIGTTILDYSPPEYHERWSELQEKLWQKEMPSFGLETCLIRKDGSIIWCRVTSILFPDRGINLGYTILEDITEEHRLRLQRQEFINIASHELRTPVANLYANIQLLNRSLSTETTITERLIKLGKRAEFFAVKLNHLTRDLLTSSSVESEVLPLHKTFFQASMVTESCCNYVELTGKHHLKYHGDHSVEIFADEQRIDQVLINLVNNAVKYGTHSTDIIIGVEKLNNEVRISVTDEGRGIAAENIPHLFDRYYQVNKNGNKGGLGLGLYISAEIVRRHKGEIGVNSELGKGTTFWFTIPNEIL